MCRSSSERNLSYPRCYPLTGKTHTAAPSRGMGPRVPVHALAPRRLDSPVQRAVLTLVDALERHQEQARRGRRALVHVHARVERMEAVVAEALDVRVGGRVEEPGDRLQRDVARVTSLRHPGPAGGWRPPVATQ